MPKAKFVSHRVMPEGIYIRCITGGILPDVDVFVPREDAEILGWIDPLEPEEPTLTDHLLSANELLTKENVHLKDENKRLAQNKLGLIAYSEDCFLLIRDLLDCYEQTRDIPTVIDALREVQTRGAELLPYLVPQKEQPC